VVERAVERLAAPDVARFPGEALLPLPLTNHSLSVVTVVCTEVTGSWERSIPGSAGGVAIRTRYIDAIG